MNTLEKILQEIDEKYVDEVGFGVECNIFSTDEECKGNSNCFECLKNKCKDIIKKNLSDNDGMISIDDERLWQILFEEACVEGQQADRIHKRLKEVCSEPYKPDQESSDAKRQRDTEEFFTEYQEGE